LSFECDSKVLPFLKSFIPSEEFTLSKLGSNLRLDLKSKPSHCFLFKGRDSYNSGLLLHCNSINSSFQNVFSLDFINDLEEEIDRIFKLKGIHKAY